MIKKGNIANRIDKLEDKLNIKSDAINYDNVIIKIYGEDRETEYFITDKGKEIQVNDIDKYINFKKNKPYQINVEVVD